MPLFQVSISISGDQVDALEELLFETDEDHWNIYLDQDTQVGVASGVYESEDQAKDGWKRLGPLVVDLLGDQNPKYELLPDTDWRDSYKVHFKPWSFGGLHWVPIWEKETYDLPKGETVVWLDPGMAFGTGNHETTRLCIEAFMSYIEERSTASLPFDSVNCCDAGCGSGILAISAKKVGITQVVGFDNDPDAVRISCENAELNGLKGEIDFYVADLESGFKNQTYDLVFANILGAVLVEHPRSLLAAIRPKGRLILSGILTTEVQEVLRAYKETTNNLGLSAEFSSHRLGEWSDVVIDLD